jgi:hypothetical protein
VENSVIAVQIANGTFVPVLNTSSKKRRRLVVTTARDNQTDVRIQLYRGSDESMSDAEYVGSLVVENVEPAESGSPDISVLLGVDESGNLNATAKDNQSGEYQSLSVGLDQFDEESGYDVPDFQLSDEELTLDELEEETTKEPPADAATDADDTLDELSFDDLEMPEEPEEPATPQEQPESVETLEPEPSAELPEEGGEELPDLEADFGELSLDDLSLDEEPATTDDEAEPEPEEELEEGLEEEAAEELAEEPAEEPEGEAAIPVEEPVDVSLEELSLDEEEELEPLEEPEAEEAAAEELSIEEPDAEQELEDEFSLDDLTFEEPEPEAPEAAGEAEELSFGEGVEPTEEEMPSQEAPDEIGALEAELGMGEEEQSGEGMEPDESDVLADFSDEDFSFDESLFEEPVESGAEPPESEKEGAEEFSLDEGMVEADLGEEDFTFDETPDEEPAFGEPETGVEEGLIEDTLSPEEFDRLDSQPAPPATEGAEEEALQPRRTNAVIFIGYMVLALAALGVLTYLVFRLLEGPPAPPLRAGAFHGIYASCWLLGAPRLPNGAHAPRHNRAGRPRVASRRAESRSSRG